jgi:amino acid adenylation domain-containing protein
MRFLNFLQFCYDKSISFALDNGQIKVNAPQGALTADVVQRLRQFKPELLEFLQTNAANEHASTQQFKHIPLVARSENLPASYGQEQLWLAQQKDNSGDSYHFVRVLELTGELGLEALNTTFSMIFQRHEALRTVFVMRDEMLLQTILPPARIDIPVTDLCDLNEVQRGESASILHRQLASAPFDLEHDLMLRLHLIRVDQHRYQLVIVLHHIASDGWSLGILVNEFQSLYTQCVQGSVPTLTPLPIQYADYAHWQRTPGQLEVLATSLKYWTKRLEGVPELHTLLTDHPRPAHQSFKGSCIYTRLDAVTTDALKQLAQRTGCTLFMVLETIFAGFIARYSGSADVVIGTPVANRQHQDVEGLIGYFVNVLALRHQIDDNASILQLLAQTKQDTVAAFSHDHVPFARVVHAVTTTRSTSYSPLVQISFGLQNNDISDLSLPGLACTLSEPGHENVIFDLTLEASEIAGQLQLCWEYASDLFQVSTLERMALNFEKIVHSALAAPDMPLNRLELISDQERSQLLVAWNDTAMDYPGDKCIHELFEAQAMQNPDAVALVYEGEQLSYGELNVKANQLAHYLVTEKQVKPDTLVGICIERSLEMVIGILGILKAGAAYVPLDPGYPQVRLEYMLEDAKLTTVLTQRHLLKLTSGGAVQAVCLDDASVQQLLAMQSVANIVPQSLGLNAQHLAYVIYTSGSTGNPKGVMIGHQGLVNLACWLGKRYELGADDKVLQFAPISFDMSVEEIFGALCSGSTLVVRGSDWIESVAHFWQCCAAVGVTVLNLPTAFWHELAHDKAALPTASVRHISIGGENVSETAIREWYARPGSLPKLLNAYGPTECTVNASTSELLPGTKNTIGQGLYNTSLLVLNAQGLPSPIGVAGELHIGGVGLSRGYLNRPELTDEKFIANPFHDVSDPSSSARLYKTGDLVRWLADGNLEYLGRIDHQVKIRGFRIELGEIENALTSHAQVSDAVVLARDAAVGGKQLVAYVVTNDTDIDAQDESEMAVAARQALIDGLRKHLGNKLPDYMVPAAYVLLTSLPLTPNGKVDRKALPEPDASQQQASYVAPRTGTEQLLCTLWQEVLGIERLGITDDFFQMGGHSLLATRLISRINHRFSTALPLKTLFESPTVLYLAEQLVKMDPGLSRPELKPLEPNRRPLLAVSRDIPLPTSYTQQLFWLMDQINGGSAHYNMPGNLTLTGNLNRTALDSAFSTILERHESLRTCFKVGADGKVLQVIQPPGPFCMPLFDLSHLMPDQRQAKVAECIAEEAAKIFDLSRDLMLRAVLLKVAADQHVLLVTMHHIAADGWSMAILFNEFSALYSAYSEGKANPLAPLPIQFADYAHWQRTWLQGPVLEQQMDYWAIQLASLPVVHSVPLDYSRPSMQTFGGDTCHSSLAPDTCMALAALCRTHGATLFMGLHAAFSVLLSRYSNESDIVVGSPIANREQAEVEPLIGCFINTLVLRCDLTNNPSFNTLLAQCKRTLLDAYAHQQVPSELIAERLAPERSLNHSRLFQIMLVLQNNEEGTLTLPGLTLGRVEQGGAVSKCDLTLNVNESGQGLELDWEYNVDLFKRSTIERMAQHFDVLLAALLRSPDDSVFKANLLSERERAQLLVEWNDTATAYPRNQCIHELFEAQAAQNPDAVALVCEGEQLSYGELNARANQLAHFLVTEKKVVPDTLVGICVERSLAMIVGIFGILKAGGAYVPLDPNYPEARLTYMVEDARLTTVVTQLSLGARFLAHGVQALCLDDPQIQRQLAGQSAANILPQSKGLQSTHLAYVIYTSGSTGNPKGVMIAHSSVVNLALDVKRRYSLGVDDGFLQFATMNFDMSVEDIFSALSSGCRLILRPDSWLQSTQYFWGRCASANVTVLDLPTAYWHELVNDSHAEVPACVRHISIGGEQVSRALIHTWRSNSRNLAITLVNTYGPTECTVDTTFAPIVDNGGNIGKAMSNAQLFVLNNQASLSPVGISGELHIGGAGLARGYLNRPDLTDEKFIANPFYDANHPSGSERLYKTGDLVRWLPDGNLEYLGRIDHQVKIRGFRIELGEIENALTSHAQVSDAVVLARDAAVGGKQLVAYVVTNDTDFNPQDESEMAVAARQALIDGLRKHLGNKLPDYMLPAAYVLLTSLPLTPNGKVDRKALPEPDVSQHQVSYVAPRTGTEQLLCGLWQEVLELERVGIADNFFHLGGHSLLATRLVARINQTFKVVMPLRVLFQSPTLEALAHAVTQLDAGLYLPPILSVPRDVALLPSYAQQRLWLLDQIDGSSAHYNIPGALKLEGTLNQDAMNLAFTTILERHESLRTCFTNGADGQPLQLIQPAAPLAIALTDLSGCAEVERQVKLAELLAENAAQVFDLSCDLMLRARLLKMATDEYILQVTMHHIASDGWSMAILINEFSALYRAYVSGQPNPLPPLAIQYADYAHWQRNWLQGEVLEQQLGYWTSQLANLPVVHSLPLDHARPNLQSFAGDTWKTQIDAATSAELNALCQSSGATLFMGLHAAFSVLLARYSNETDIVVGSPIANREQAEVAGLIGFFVNTLIFRCDLSGNPSFTALLGQSKNMLLDAYAHQQVPFEQIVERLQPARNMSHSPLFQIMLVLQNNEDGRPELPGLTLSLVEQVGAVAKYDLTLNISESEQGLRLDWEYNTDLFEAATIVRMAQHFHVLLKALISAPEASVLSADMLSAAERHQLLVEWNDTAKPYPDDKCIHELFEEQVAQNPDAVAVVFEGQQLSYAELNARANQLAHYLVTEKQVKPDMLVGICVERSLDMVIGILAILKAGGAYVPLDPDYPPARLEYMLGDANLTTVLTQRHLLARTPVSTAQAVCLDDADVQQLQATLPAHTVSVQARGLHAQHLAYVIYTSGSTGNPKASLLSHSGLCNLAMAQGGAFALTPASRVLQFASIAFDAATWEWCMALSHGASIVILSNATAMSPDALSAVVEQYRVTHATLPPVLLPLLKVAQWQSVHTLIVAGDACSGQIARLWSADRTFINAYGPSEATVCATMGRYQADQPCLHIGKPLQNVKVYVLTQGQELVPPGVAGELYIGGVGLSRGYLNRPDLTAEKFIANPFYDANDRSSSERLYKTGDLVRWLADGNLEFLGRIDHQVKIRGFRIELGEIENALTSHPQVSDAVVLARDAAAGDKRLVAYVVTNDADFDTKDESEAGKRTRQALIDGLRQHLDSRLPDYMVPAMYVLLGRLPLTPNGKVDRKALPEPDVSQQQPDYVAPRTEMEQRLCSLWQELLGVERVGVYDNFFQLGGHSLLATRMATCINQEFGISLRLKELFHAQTVDLLVNAINAHKTVSGLRFDENETLLSNEREITL